VLAVSPLKGWLSFLVSQLLGLLGYVLVNVVIVELPPLLPIFNALLVLNNLSLLRWSYYPLIHHLYIDSTNARNMVADDANQTV